jgi:hypothetical protein
MRNDLSAVAAGRALHEIYIVYARLRNALRIIVRIQLSGIAEFAINRSPPKTQLPRKLRHRSTGDSMKNLNEPIGSNHVYKKPVIRTTALLPSSRFPPTTRQVSMCVGDFLVVSTRCMTRCPERMFWHMPAIAVKPTAEQQE